MSDLKVTVSRTIKAPIERVYNAWLDPITMARFMTPAPDIVVPQAETDPRVGGRFSFVMQNGDEQYPHGGEYLTLTPYSQIVISWESPFSAAGSTVTVNLKETADGTHIELIHLKFPDAETRDSHENGWGHIVDCLLQVLEGEAA